MIVFEYLEMKGKLSGKKKQKLQMWRAVSYTHLDVYKRQGRIAWEYASLPIQLPVGGIQGFNRIGGINHRSDRR